MTRPLKDTKIGSPTHRGVALWIIAVMMGEAHVWGTKRYSAATALPPWSIGPKGSAFAWYRKHHVLALEAQQRAPAKLPLPSWPTMPSREGRRSEHRKGRSPGCERLPHRQNTSNQQRLCSMGQKEEWSQTRELSGKIRRCEHKATTVVGFCASNQPIVDIHQRRRRKLVRLARRIWSFRLVEQPAKERWRS